MVESGGEGRKNESSDLLRLTKLLDEIKRFVEANNWESILEQITQLDEADPDSEENEEYAFNLSSGTVDGIVKEFEYFKDPNVRKGMPDVAYRLWAIKAAVELKIDELKN